MQDLTIAYSKKINSYVVTPGGKLYKFSYEDLTVTLLPVLNPLPTDRKYVYNEEQENTISNNVEDALKILRE